MFRRSNKKINENPLHSLQSAVAADYSHVIDEMSASNQSAVEYVEPEICNCKQCVVYNSRGKFTLVDVVNFIKATILFYSYISHPNEKLSDSSVKNRL